MAAAEMATLAPIPPIGPGGLPWEITVKGLRVAPWRQRPAEET
jgi:hypothetical protein